MRLLKSLYQMNISILTRSKLKETNRHTNEHRIKNLNQGVVINSEERRLPRRNRVKEKDGKVDEVKDGEARVNLPVNKDTLRPLLEVKKVEEKEIRKYIKELSNSPPS